jgi:hypothetical protein
MACTGRLQVWPQHAGAVVVPHVQRQALAAPSAGAATARAGPREASAEDVAPSVARARNLTHGEPRPSGS